MRRAAFGRSRTSPRYLAANRDKIERQMQLEIENPTPLHAADLQFQAFVDFDSSKALPDVRARTLVVTGDRDQLIPPQNSKVLASLIPGARLVVLRGSGHRAIWEAPKQCVALVAEFLERRATSKTCGSELNTDSSLSSAFRPTILVRTISNDQEICRRDASDLRAALSLASSFRLRRSLE